MRNERASIFVLSLLCAPIVILAFFIGPNGFDLDLVSLRATRVFLGMFAGASLGLTGCALQALMRNPLADPYMLGVSGGAAAFGSAAIILLPFSSALVTPLASWIGSMLVSLALIYFLKREPPGSTNKALLLGIAINTFASSFITVMKTLAPMRDTQTLLFWLIGSIGYPDLTWLLAAFVMSAPCFWIILRRAPALELLRLGDDEAMRLGIFVAKEKRLIYLAASCLVGVSVSLCGMIAFVGLITPHLLRPFVGIRQQRLLPMSAILGIALVIGVDTLSRFSYHLFGTELPVGALIALLGAPVFVWILATRGHSAPH